MVIILLGVALLSLLTTIAVLLPLLDSTPSGRPPRFPAVPPFGTLSAQGTNIALCLAAGVLGSSVAALLSVLDRIANGWEYANGAKEPVDGKPDRFVRRMSALFLVRPVLGAIVGVLLYLVIVGKTVLALPDARTNPAGLTLLAFLAGFLAKTFLDKLKAAFKALLGE